MDAGWLNTVEEYLNGKGTTCVRCIYEQVLRALNNTVSSHNRTFIFCEVVFLRKVWDLLQPTQRELFKRFVKDKRIEIVNGGYVMNDEATPHFEDIID